MELKTYLTILSRRKWIILLTFVAILAMVLITAQYIPAKYSATARLRINTPIGGSSSYVDFNIWYADRLMNTYADLATSSSIREELKQELNLLKPPDISVGVVPSSELIKITAKSGNPELSAKIANTLAEIIIEQSSGSDDRARSEMYQYLENRKTEVAAQLEQAKKEYQAMIQPVAADKARIEALGRTIDQDQQVYITLKDNYEQNLAKGVSAVILASSNKQMKELSAKIDQEQIDLEALNMKLTESLEEISIAERAVNLYEGESTNIVAMLDQTTITDIIQENTYAIPVIDPALPPSTQSSTTRLLVYVIGVIVSLAGALSIGFLVDSLDTRLFTSDQIHEVTQLEFLGKIPPVHGYKPGGLTENHSAYREAIRRLRINIIRIANEKQIKSLIFCSADPREGKSTLLSSLAIDFAQTGNRVMLVDVDLRKPSIQEQFELPNDVGLSSYLEGEAELQQIIQSTPYQNLEIITSGPVLADPAGALSASALAELLELLEAEYFLVLIDAPAILAVSDVDEIAALVDGTILVVDRGHAQEPKIRATIRLLNNLRVKPLGMVINRAESNGTYHYYERQRKRSVVCAQHAWIHKLRAYFAHNQRS